MRSMDSDIGVPFVERRRHKRYLTLRNFGYFVLAVALIVAGFNIRSEMRGGADDDYGRLYGREMKKAPSPEASVVTEAPVAPVDEAASADPFALDAARREQYLGRPELEPVPLVEPEAIQPTHTASASAGTDASAVTIVGGPEGVAIAQDERRKPVLGGGFGRP